MNIIVTGASRGIGYSLVKNFGSGKGHKILAISRTRSKLEKLAESCSGGESEVHIMDLDLNKHDAGEKIKEHIEKEFHRVDILINNAGYLVSKPFEELDNDDFDSMIQTNLKVPFNLIKWLVPYLSLDAHIVNIGSMGGFQGSVKFPGLSLYSASKGALAILTECLAEEYKEKNLNFNCLAIGAAQTEMLDEAFPGYQAPLSAEEMADFIVDFALTGHRFFNGKVLPVAVSTP
jgi:short-subunit dehydrogenase